MKSQNNTPRDTDGRTVTSEKWAMNKAKWGTSKERYSKMNWWSNKRTCFLAKIKKMFQHVLLPQPKLPKCCLLSYTILISKVMLASTYPRFMYHLNTSCCTNICPCSNLMLLLELTMLCILTYLTVPALYVVITNIDSLLVILSVLCSKASVWIISFAAI